MSRFSSLSRPKLWLLLFGSVAGCTGQQSPTLLSIAVTPASPSIAQGLTQDMKAIGTLSGNSTQDVTSLATWSSSNQSVATITASGLATAKGVGSATMTASVDPGPSIKTASGGSLTGSTLLTVTTPLVVSLTLTPANPALELGASQAFKATGTMTDNTSRDLTHYVVWSSSDVAVLRFNPFATGIANSRGPGTATVTATVTTSTSPFPPSDGGTQATTTASVTRPTPKFLYASNVGAANVSAFGVDPSSGALTAIGTPVATTSGATSIAPSHDYKFLYSADFGNDKLSGWVIQADGSLTPVAGTPLSIADGPLSVVAHPSANFLYVSTQGSGITVVATDPTSGAPTIKSSVTIGNAPQFGAMTPDGAFFYQTVSATDQIAGFSVDGGSGALSALASPPATTGTFPRALAVDPGGKFLYVAVSGAGTATNSTTVEGFMIIPYTGGLATIAGSPFDAGVNPVSAAIDPSGRFLFVANFSSSSVSAYAIDFDTGVLTEVAGSPFGTPAFPLFVTVDPSAQYVYVGTDGSGGIAGFIINQATGALAPNDGGSAAGSSVWSIAVTR
jgi:6-phosphogluconolactonase